MVFIELHTDVKCAVQLQVADHRALLVQVRQSIPSEFEIERGFWNWKQANWKASDEELEHIYWDRVFFEGSDREPSMACADRAVERFTN